METLLQQTPAAPDVEELRALLAGPAPDLAALRAQVEPRLRAEPERFEWLDLEAAILQRQGEHGLAIRLLEEYQRFAPSDPSVAWRLAQVRWAAGEREQALADAKAAQARHPEDPRLRRDLAVWANEAGDHDLAARLASEALDRDPADGEAALALGRAGLRLGSERIARRGFEAARLLRPDDATVATAYAEFLLNQNHSGEAARLLEPFAVSPAAPPATLLRFADASFRANQPAPAVAALRRIFTACEEESYQREGLETAQRELGLQGFDSLAFELIEAQQAADLFALQFIEFLGVRGHRGNLLRLLRTIGAHPLRFPRTMARYLSTYHYIPLLPGAMGRWIRAHQTEVNAEPILWGGVGAFHVERGRWRDAVAHLSAYPTRPGVKPWMILLLGRALEGLDQRGEANLHYREALRLPPDHSETGLRSRLAFNLALEGLCANGELVLLEGSRSSRALATTEDLARMVCVEAFCKGLELSDEDDRAELLQGTMKQLAEFVKEAPGSEVPQIRALFRRRFVESVL